MGLCFWRRRCRGQGGRPQPARRQGRQPCRDVQPRPAGAARLHHHDRGLQRLLRQWTQPFRPSSRRRWSAALGHISRHCRQAISAIPTKLLLVSVRSGARASMPGMMDTVLNLGLNDVTVEALAADSGDARFAYDSYRRFIQMYSDVVLGLDHEIFEEMLEDEKGRLGLELDTEFSADQWRHVIGLYKQKVEEELGKPFPQDPHEQLWGAIGAVFSSWMNTRAITYRRLHDIPESWGTAVNVQAMVFGNMGETSATGVAFTRNPSTGEKSSTANSWSMRRARMSWPASARRRTSPRRPASTPVRTSRRCKKLMPEAFTEFVGICDRLEKHYRDMQDIEFTIERGKLWMLQTRSGKRTAKAAICVAVEMAKEGLITREEAIVARRPGLARPAAAPDHRSQGRAQHHRCRPAGLARRCDRRDRVFFRRGRGHEGQGPQGGAGAHRDQPRGHPRHARRRRHPDHARRHDQPCRRGGPRHGQAVRFRGRLAACRLPHRHADGDGRHVAARATSSPSTAAPGRC